MRQQPQREPNTKTVFMNLRQVNRMPWLAALLCLSLALVAKATDASAALKTPDSRPGSAQPKLAEQDVWLRWKLAHDAHQHQTATGLTAGLPSAIQAGNPVRATRQASNPGEPAK